MKSLINLLLLTALAAPGTRASLIAITLDDPDQTGNPGQTLQFFGTITNTDTNVGDAPVYLNSDSLNLELSDAVANDLFFTTVPIDLAEGASSDDIELFDYTLADPEGDPFGVYGGNYVLLGGMDGGADTAFDNLAQVSFSVDVEPLSATPEPATLALLGIGLALTGCLNRRRRFSGRGRALRRDVGIR